MSNIEIVRSALRSHVIRELVGERTIDIFKGITTPEEQNEGGIFSWITGIGSRLVGFLFGAVGSAIQWLLSNLWDIIVEASFEIANFDWNQTDAQIQEQINQNNLQIIASLGDLAGSGSVWLVSVGLAGLASIKFPVIGAKIALALAEEGGEEIRGQIASLLTVTRNAVTRNVVLGGFLSARRMRLFGLAPITQQREPWTIAGEIEERVESIQNDALRTFVDSFLESATDALLEVGYVVSYAVDDYYATAKLANQSLMGKERAVIIEPDRRTDGETIVLRGAQHQLTQDIQTTLATYQMVHNRDVGQIVGQPAEDWLRAGMQRRKLTVTFKSKETPPWINPIGQERVRSATYTIPEAKVGLTWREIKTACQHFTWGKYRATANLENGRQMAVYGATEAEAERKLRELMQLSTLSLLTLSVTQEKDRHPNLRKDATEMYPAFATLLIRRSTAELTGTNDLSGANFREEHIRMDLWTTEEPEGIPPLQ